ncbi:hypothetical protein [Arthrobacter sp. SD76]|uniref:hypothetical protein n=1 Tax=Arthrobacter sp. SD76 TaxID=3415007 RepID=UPI003C76069A
MKNDVRIATFSIRHELGPVYLGYRAPEGEYVTRRVVDAPVKLEFAAIPERIKSGFGVTSLELMDANLIGTTAEDCSAFRNALAEHGVSLGLVGASRAAGDADRQHREEDLAAIELLIDTAAELGTEQVRVILLPRPSCLSPPRPPSRTWSLHCAGSPLTP